MDSSSASKSDIAFVIPARNEVTLIGAALESIIEQSLPRDRLEVVVVENGSNDGTATAALQKLSTVPDLRDAVVSEPVASIPGAKNRGAHEATAPILIFLDADSRAAPDLAERVLEWVGRGYPAGSIRIVADSADPIDRGFFALIDWGKGLFNIHANMLYCDRELFLRSGGFGESIHLAEDLEFLVRLERQGVRVCHVSDSFIATSPRRLRELPLRLGMVKTFGRWALAHVGIGRRWRY
jgi:glycosyltransferase involved in cell wall biosynthesis